MHILYRCVAISYLCVWTAQITFTARTASDMSSPHRRSKFHNFWSIHDWDTEEILMSHGTWYLSHMYMCVSYSLNCKTIWWWDVLQIDEQVVLQLHLAFLLLGNKDMAYLSPLFILFPIVGPSIYNDMHAGTFFVTSFCDFYAVWQTFSLYCENDKSHVVCIPLLISS